MERTPVKAIIQKLMRLIKNLQKQVGDLERQSKLSHSPLYTDELRSLKAQVDMLRAQNDQWKASSQDRQARGREKTNAHEEDKERYLRGKAKADLAIAKHKTTRKRKK